MTNAGYSHLAGLLAPEIILVLTALVVLFADLQLFRMLPPGERRRRAGWLTAVGGCVAAMTALTGLDEGGWGQGMVVIYPAGQVLKAVLGLLLAGTALVAAGTEFTDHGSEFCALLALATTGMALLLSTQSLLLLFVSLELVSLPLYAMTAFNKRSPAAAEAALKYFLFGGMAAGFALFGFSLLYGLTGSIDMSVMASRLAQRSGDPAAMAAVVMVLTGFGFKIAAIPFHLWAPDAYEGAPAPAAAFIASGSKVASFAVLIRMLQIALPGVQGSAGWSGASAGWAMPVAVMALASMVLGNLGALAQTRIRRLAAYSAVAHAGYGLLGVFGNPSDGAPALFYFVSTYAVTLVGLFAVISAVEGASGDDSIQRFAGLGSRSPVLALCLTIFILSLAGIPPFAGFFGKFFVFASAARAGGSLGYLWLVMAGIAMSCVSLYYYLLVLKQVWVADATPESEAPGLDMGVRVTAVLFAVLVVVLGLLPEVLLSRFKP